MNAEESSIPILRLTASSVTIDTRALNSVLEQVGNRRFACFSTAGPKRTGKSFILNKCLQFLLAKQANTRISRRWFQRSSTGQRRFEWRGGSERNTLGINIWSRPFFTEHKGQEIAILLMDTQGSFDDQTTSTQNSIIFALSALMSSILIYNIPRDIGQDTLEFLQLFTGYAKLAINDNDQGEEENAFQKLIFLIRDFQFSDFRCGYYDERTCPPGQSENFRQRLNPQTSQPNEVRVLRQEILNSFHNIGVFALPHPGNQLATADDETNLDENFAKYAKEFVEFLFSEENIELKKVGPLEVTGSQFTKYVTAWARLFQGNSLPEMKSISQVAAEMQNKILIQKFLTKYDKGMNKSMDSNPQGISDRKFKTLHSELEEKYVRAFRRSKKLGGTSFEETFLNELKDGIAARKKTYQDMNSANWRATEKHNKLEGEIEENKKALKKVELKSKREKEKLTEKYKQWKLEADQMADKLEAITRDKKEQEREMKELKEEIGKKKRDEEKTKSLRKKSPERPCQAPPILTRPILDIILPTPRIPWPVDQPGCLLGIPGPVSRIADEIAGILLADE